MPRCDSDQYVEMTMHFKCNLRCEHCMILDTMKRLEPEPMSRFEQLLDYNRRNRRWRGIILTGAEVTLREDLPDLARKARNGGFEHVRIQTHGMRLSDGDYCRRLVDAGVDEYFISVAAADAATHDAITRVPGSFEKTIRGLWNLDAFNDVNVLTNTVMTRTSYRQLPGIVEMLGPLRRLVEMDFWNYWPMSEGDEKDLIVSHGELAPFLLKAIQRARELGRQVEVKNFPQCLLGEFGDALRNAQPRLFIDPDFWPQFMRNGFHQCVHKSSCGSTECLGLNTAYIRKYGWEEKSLQPVGNPKKESADGHEVLEAAGMLGRFGVERSIAIREGAVYANRFLATATLSEVAADSRDRVLNCCVRLGMPPEQMQQVDRYLPTTRFVHLGYEEGKEGRIFKVYLEQKTPIRPQKGQAIPLHYGFKWAPGSAGRHVVTEYVWRPGISMEEIGQRVDDAYGEEVHEEERALAREMLELAGGMVAEEDLRYMEVSEAGNPRRSFDVNVYDGGLKVGRLAGQLERMRSIFKIPLEHWAPTIRVIGDERLGHIAGGIHRDGLGFFNLYYGVKPWRE